MSQPTLLSRQCQLISSLIAGLQPVSFQAVVTNIVSCRIDDKSPKTATGCLKMLITDGSGDIFVKLFHADANYDNIQLGHHVRVSTTQICSVPSATFSISAEISPEISLHATIFPDEDSADQIEALQEHNSPGVLLANTLLQRQNHILDLDKFFDNKQEDKQDISILVMVWDVGSPTTVTTKLNTTFQALDVSIVDGSSLHTLPHPSIVPTKLSLTVPLFNSARTFIRRQTLLLIHLPKTIDPFRRRIKLTAQSQVYINPDISEARLLREWIDRLFPPLPSAYPLQLTSLPPAPSPNKPSRNCSCTSKFTTIQTRQSKNELTRDQYTLALFLDEIELRHLRKRTRAPYWRKFAPDPSFIAYISVLITRVSLAELYRSQRIFCGRCAKCAQEVFGNTPVREHACHEHVDSARTEGMESSMPHAIDASGHRLHIKEKLKLRLNWNSSILAGFSDETGGLNLRGHNERHNLTLTEEAIRGLTGLTCADFNTADDRSGHVGKELTSSSTTVDSTASAKEGEMLARLRWIESHLLWARVTLVMGWTDACADHDTRMPVGGASGGKERVVVLDVLS